MQKDPKLWCYCRDAPDLCPLEGTIELYMCTNAPLIASRPHFYNADPILRRNIKGMNPSKEKHDVIVDFHMVN